ncbi:DUF262 domain-containing protein [Deinococcus marmoris]|uniref:DUF262 domain-containing protein n=1 Tax=Deinococcus marmoris TaxID=249408 RepID=UPI000495ACA0|nr:DUF262 domain-containing protein [Deinococcus marmoris]
MKTKKSPIPRPSKPALTLNNEPLAGASTQQQTLKTDAGALSESAQQATVNWKAEAGLGVSVPLAAGVVEAASDVAGDATISPHVASLLSLLQMPRQYRVPHFRRSYCWQLEQWATLWDDVLAAGRTGRKHFTGTLAYVIRPDDDIETAAEVSLIDGQQRLVTILLLLIALARSLQPSGSFMVKNGGVISTASAASLLDFLTMNEPQRHRLVLVKPDHDTLNWLIDSLSDPHTSSPADLSTAMIDALAYFERQLAVPGIELATVYAGLQQLEVTCIAVTHGPVYPTQTVQQIVDSLNTTRGQGELTQAHRILLYALRVLGHQQGEELYGTHWWPMEALFSEMDEGAFERFIRGFLSSRSQVPVRPGDVYAAFRCQVEQGGPPVAADVRALVIELAQAAHHMALNDA